LPTPPDSLSQKPDRLTGGIDSQADKGLKCGYTGSKEAGMTTESNQDIKTAIDSLKANRFDTVVFAEDADTAVKTVLDIIPPEANVGTGGSMTIRQIGLRDELTRRGNIQIARPGQGPAEEPRRLQSEIMLSSSNAVTLDGKLVNMDSTGNRVARMIYGPQKVILVVGQNKIVRNVDEAIERIKHVIAPYHGMTMKIQAPCAVDGKCTDCKSPGRICNVTTIIEKKPRRTEFAIVLVGQDLGLGWDPDWPEERRERIASAYRAAWEDERASFRRPQS
jgi:hypothetical protein